MIESSAVNSVFQALFRVYFEDTDQMGVMYHANYLRFFERGRTDMFRALGWSLVEFAKVNYHFAIHGVQLRYLYPARLNDELLVKTQIIKQSACSIAFEQSMKNQDNRVLCDANVQVVCVDGTMAPQRLPNLMRSK